MTLSMKRLWSALHLGGLTPREAAVRTWQRIDEHAILTRAAAIAFYAIAALIPFMGLLVALTAAVAALDQRSARRQGCDRVDRSGRRLAPG